MLSNFIRKLARPRSAQWFWNPERPGVCLQFDAPIGSRNISAKDLRLVGGDESIAPYKLEKSASKVRAVWEKIPALRRENEALRAKLGNHVIGVDAAGAGRPQDRTPSPPLCGHFEGFDATGRILGWAVNKQGDETKHVFLRCGSASLPLEVEIHRQDVVDAGHPDGRGFLFEVDRFLPLLPDFFRGAALRVESENSSLVGRPVYWSALKPLRQSELLWLWLAQFFAAQLKSQENDSKTLRLLDDEFSRLQALGFAGLGDERGAVECVRAMQETCGTLTGTTLSSRANITALLALTDMLSRRHAVWSDASAGFAAALLVDDLLTTVRSNWEKNGLFIGSALDEPSTSSDSGHAATPALHGSKLHLLPWEGWVRTTLLGTLELARNLRSIPFDATTLATHLESLEKTVALLYRDNQILAELRRVRRELALPATGGGGIAREAESLARQSKYLQALTIDHLAANDETRSPAAQFATQLGAACEIGRPLPAATIREKRKQLAQAGSAYAADPFLQLAVKGYLEMADRLTSQTASLGAKTAADDRRIRHELLVSMVELLDLTFASTEAKPAKPGPARGQRVLIVGSRDLPQVHLYRQAQKIEALKSLFRGKEGWRVEHVDTWELINDPKLTRRLAGCDILVVCRLPATLPVLRLIHGARRAGVRVIYEIDDLIFDEENFPPPYETYSGSITRREHRQLGADTVLWLEAMRMANELVVSTTTLAERARALLGSDVPIHIEPNCQPEPLRRLAKIYSSDVSKAAAANRVRLVYGTGTKAHKQIIDEWILPVLNSLAEKHEDLEIVLVGRLQGLPQGLANHPLVKVVPFIDYGSYLEILATADISLAAIEPGTATDAKSGLKWMEAAVLGAASVVSPSATYREFLEDGRDVLFASTKEEWEQQLSRLIMEPALRRRIAKAAKDKACKDFSPVVPAKLWQRIHSNNGPPTAGVARGTKRPLKLLLANLYFWPQAEGGATRVVEDQIRELRAKYADQYEITVLCTDRFAHDGAVDVYAWEGVRVVRLHARSKSWHAHFDEDVREFMDQWFQREKFDILHVHALQVLTASVVQAALEAGIPYVITLHDAWWICSRQFLTSPSGRAIDPAEWRDESDVLRALPLPDGAEHLLRALNRNAWAQSAAARRGRSQELAYLREARRKLDAKLDKLIPEANLHLQMYSTYVRRQDLHDILRHAAKLLAVSTSFAKLYEDAGVEGVGVLGNSWQVYRPSPPRQDDAKLECAFIGGWSIHKGAGVLLEACRMIKADNIKLTIVDHALPPGESHHVKWGSVAVRFIAPRPLAEMEDFYRSIDVLIAPSIWPESFGLVTREALTAGVWVIAAESGALAEPVQEGINGNVVPPRDAQALAEAIEKAASPEGRAALRRWRENAMEGCGLTQPPDNADALHRIYNEVALR